MDEKIKKRERLIQRDTVLKNKKIKKKKNGRKEFKRGIREEKEWCVCAGVRRKQGRRGGKQSEDEERGGGGGGGGGVGGRGEERRGETASVGRGEKRRRF